MAHLWINEAAGGWMVFPLDSCPVILHTCPPRAISDAHDSQSAGCILFPCGDGVAQTRWVLLAGASTDVRINGRPIRLGIRILAERDEIRVERVPPVFFSAERLASIEPFQGAETPLHCPRCKQEIEPRTLAVQCPGCGVWHHQAEELPCYTYAEKCASCSRKTDLNAGYSWSPEEL